MKIYWTEEAKDSLKQTYQYFKSEVSLKFAQSFKKAIFEKVKQLKSFSSLGQKEEILADFEK